MKITVKDIEFDEDKLKKLFLTHKKMSSWFIMIHYYSDETNIESEVEHTNNKDGDDEAIIKKKQHITKKTTRTPPVKKQKKKQQGIMD